MTFLFHFPRFSHISVTSLSHIPEIFLIFSMAFLSHVPRISYIFNDIPVSCSRNFSYFKLHPCLIFPELLIFSMTSLSCDPRISHIFNNIPVLISRNFSFPTTPLPQRHSLTHSKQWKTAERLRCT